MRDDAPMNGSALTELPDGLEGFFRPVGYLVKRIETPPSYLKPPHLEGVYAVSHHISRNIAEEDLWKRNAYGLFDSLEIAQAAAERKGSPLEGSFPMYLEAYSREYFEGEGVWRGSRTEWGRLTEVAAPIEPMRIGFDAVTYCGGKYAECSPLSCNHLVNDMPESVNRFCLFDTFEEARRRIESEEAVAEPGPYRILAAHAVRAPWE